MDNPETQETLGTTDTGQINIRENNREKTTKQKHHKNTTQKTKKVSNMNHTKHGDEPI